MAKVKTRMIAALASLMVFIGSPLWAGQPAPGGCPPGPVDRLFGFGFNAQGPSTEADPGKPTVMFFTGAINSQSAASFRAELEEWAARRAGKPGHIRIIMDSPGGEVFAASGVIDELWRLRFEKHKITIVVNGMAASAAGWILQAADERIIGPNSWIMIHGVSSSASGKIGAIEADLALTKRLEAKGLNFLAQRSKLPMEEIKRHIDSGEDWWLDAQEALKYGFVDSINGIPFADPSGKK